MRRDGETAWIEERGWDDGNLAELARHGLRRRTVLQVARRARFRRNRRHRAATHKMIGADDGGALWVVCIVETTGRGRWTAVTGWPAEAEDQAWYRRQ